jgi:hypothetical protein
MSDTNTGHYNSGHYNSGDYNSGYRNSGHYNSGNRNSGNRNSGDYNSGHYNSGHYNSGHYNSGHYNSGNRNSGDYNSGYRNSGHYNSGNRNSGNWNSTNYSSGHFNTVEQPFYMFNRMVENIKREDINVFANIELTKWILSENMTDEEKKENPNWETREGYLREYSFQEACKNWWAEADQDTKNRFLSLPNFDPSIFKKITGIDVNQPTKKSVTLELTDEQLEKIKEILGE